MKPPAVSRRVFADIDEQAACLGGYDQHYQQLGRGRFAGSFATRAVGADVTVHVEEVNLDLYQRGRTPGGSFSVGLLLQQAGCCSFGGELIDGESLVVFPAGIEFDCRLAAASRFCVVDIGQQHLDAQHGADGVAPSALRRSGTATVLRAGHARLAGLRQLIAAAMQADGGVASPHLELALSDALVGQALVGQALLLSTGPAAPGTPRGGSARQRHRVYCRARDHLVAHAAEPFSMADLCRAASVSRRTLEHCFVAATGAGPAAYLRTLRLNGLRRELLARPPGTETIGDIAARWGFWHPSRMAGDYRAQFGELPSQTAARSGP